MSQLVVLPHSHLIPPLLSSAHLSRHVTAAYWAGSLRKISRTRSPRTDGKKHTARLLSRSSYSLDLFTRRERRRRHLGILCRPTSLLLHRPAPARPPRLPPPSSNPTSGQDPWVGVVCGTPLPPLLRNPGEGHGVAGGTQGRVGQFLHQGGTHVFTSDTNTTSKAALNPPS